MDVILREYVPHLGEAGAVVKVKPGYARNYLIPHGKALAATDGNKRRIAHERERKAEQLALQKTEAETIAAKLGELSLTFTAKTGDGDRLFGSITSADIAEKLAASGVSVDKRSIEMTEPIRVVGAHQVPIRLHAEVKPEITVTVERE